MPEEPPAHPSRRSILTGAVAAAAALAVQALGRPKGVDAASGDNVVLGVTNYSNLATEIQGIGTVALIAQTGSEWTGVVGGSNTGIGVMGQSTDGTGVVGRIGNQTGAVENPAGMGIYGFSNVSSQAVGVRGDSVLGTGLIGRGEVGIRGSSGSLDGSSDVADTAIFGFANRTAASVGIWGETVGGTGVIGTGDVGMFASGATVGVLSDVTLPRRQSTGMSGQIWRRTRRREWLFRRRLPPQARLPSTS